MTARLVSAELERRSVPLKRPYALSFTTLPAFDTLLVRLTTDAGERLTGEVVPLPGYSPETAETVAAAAESILPRLPGSSLEAARETTLRRLADQPFAASLILSALDSRGLETPAENNQNEAPIVGAVSSSSSDLEGDLCRVMDEGYSTVKVKVGRSLAEDLEAVPKIERVVRHGTAAEC